MSSEDESWLKQARFKFSDDSDSDETEPAVNQAYLQAVAALKQVSTAKALIQQAFAHTHTHTHTYVTPSCVAGRTGRTTKRQIQYPISELCSALTGTSCLDALGGVVTCTCTI